MDTSPPAGHLSMTTRDATRAKGMAIGQVDDDDTYNKAEASSSEWFQIPHD